jgi:hypothetical protein
MESFIAEEMVDFPGRFTGKNTPDRLTLWIAHSLMPFHHSLLTGSRKSLAWFFRGFVSLWHRQRRSTGFSERILTPYSAIHIIRVASITITFVACLLPTITIIAFSKINSVLGLITAFAALFALGLIFFWTSSSRQEIFLATIG